MKTQNPEEYYKCGYIDPQGNYYAKNGNIMDNLHIQIEDELLKNGIINCEKHNTRIYLEENGWCVVCDDWVQFPGYNNEKWVKKPIIGMTTPQLITLKIYSVKYNGSLRFGYSDLMSLARFEILYFRNHDKMIELFSV